MNVRYKRYQAFASLCVAIFIINMAFALTCGNKFIYRITYSNKAVHEAEQLTDIQARIVYNQLSDDFISFFKKDYDLPGYELSEDNINKLNTMKWAFRRAIIWIVLSMVGFVYSYLTLSRRRELRPLLYGSVLSLLFTAIRALRIVLAKTGVRAALGSMVLKRDYGYFAKGDVLEILIPDTFARNMALLYCGWTVMLVVSILLVRRILIITARPHEF